MEVRGNVRVALKSEGSEIELGAARLLRLRRPSWRQRWRARTRSVNHLPVLLRIRSREAIAMRAGADALLLICWLVVLIGLIAFGRVAHLTALVTRCHRTVRIASTSAWVLLLWPRVVSALGLHAAVPSLPAFLTQLVVTLLITRLTRSAMPLALGQTIVQAMMLLTINSDQLLSLTTLLLECVSLLCLMALLVIVRIAMQHLIRLLLARVNCVTDALSLSRVC